MKYIVLRRDVDGFAVEYPIVFPNALVHKDVADSLQRLFKRQLGADVKTVSGGFISSLHVGKPGACHGASDSLGVKSRGDVDDSLMAMYDYVHGLC